MGEAVISRRDSAWMALLCLAIGLPFLDKPFHIDDPFILAISQNVLDNPLNPFAGYSSWFGQPDPIWKMATNPPLISYWLAPFAALSDYSEAVLHAAMLPFTFLLGMSLLWLGGRFTSRPWMTALFVMTSAGVVVSGNVMRDVPTLALSTTAIAACVAGSDRRQPALSFASAVLAALAILMKYSAAIVLPLLVLYPLLRRRFAASLWVGVSFALILAWSGHNYVTYGETQIGLLLTRDWGRLASWRDNLSGMPVVVGSLLYLFPALALRSSGRDAALPLAALCMAVVLGLTQWYLDGYGDAQYLFWSLTGSGLVFLCAFEAVRGSLGLARDLEDETGQDSFFLLAWLAAPLLFSVIFVPFQAVRHLLPALAPLVLLSLRAIDRDGEGERIAVMRPLLMGLVALQAIVAFAVAAADYEHAAAYRSHAEETRSRYEGQPGSTWYIGHWGWTFYGQRAGFTQLDPGGPYPQRGDRLVQPTNYYNGKVPSGSGAPGGPPRMVEVESKSYPALLRLRAMHPAGAGFYAMYSRRDASLPNVPYRWLPPYPLEAFVTYEAR